MNNNRITFVLVLYKSEKIIDKCLFYLKNFKVIILDNSMNLSLKKKILEKYDNIIDYIIPKKNLGFSAGNNLAAKCVKSEFIYFLSPDVFLINQNLTDLIKEFDNNAKLGLITPTLIDQNKNILNNKMFFPEKNYKKDNTQSQNDFDWIWGASMMIRKNVFKLCDGFDERFFIYNSDVDLCKKIKSLKYEIKEYSQMKIIHLGAKSSNISFSENCKLKISHKLSLYQYLNKYNLLKKTKLIVDFFDFFQRMIFNLIIFRFEKSFINFLRIISIFIFLIY